MQQVFLLTHLPVLLHRLHDRVLHQITRLVRRRLIGEDVQLDPASVRCWLLLFAAQHRPVFRPHLYEIVNTLPYEAIMLRLEQGVEIIGLGWDGCAGVDDVFLLLVDVFEIFGLVLHLELLLVGVEEGLLQGEVVENGVVWTCQRVEEGVELLLGPSIVDVELLLLVVFVDHLK